MSKQYLSCHFIIFDEKDEISIGNLNDALAYLEELKDKTMREGNLEEDYLRFWNNLQTVAYDLNEPKAMKLPYAEEKYPILLALCDEIRAELQKRLEGSENNPKNWRLFRGE